MPRTAVLSKRPSVPPMETALGSTLEVPHPYLSRDLQDCFEQMIKSPGI